MRERDLLPVNIWQTRHSYREREREREILYQLIYGKPGIHIGRGRERERERDR